MLQSVHRMQLLISYIILHPAILVALAVTILLSYIFYLDHKIVVLTQGQSGVSLEEIIKECLANSKTIEDTNKAIIKHVTTLDTKISHAVRNVQTIRYKAFDVNGSNQSFSIALVNEKGNGVIISSLHSHDRMSTFAKPITAYESTYELTEEELAILDDTKAEHGAAI